MIYNYFGPGVTTTFEHIKIAEDASPIKIVVEEISKDKNYRRSWEANIAMAFIDCTRWYKKENNREYLTKKDLYDIAQNSAKHFLDILVGDYKDDSTFEINLIDNETIILKNDTII